MTTIYVILIVLASGILGMIVLIQNPKGGGLAGNIAGFSSQFMGVKQTTDVLEKGTWTFAAVIGALCLLSTFFISKSQSTVPNKMEGVGGTTVPGTTQPTIPNNSVPLTPTKPDSNNK